MCIRCHHCKRALEPCQERPKDRPKVNLMKPITQHLGYPNLIHEPNYFDTPRQTRISEVCLSLERIDGALLDGALDSMAVKISDAEVNYSQHSAMLKQEGDRLLRELSNLAAMPILFNRFTGQNNQGLATIDGYPNPYPPLSISQASSQYSIVSPYC